VDTNLPLWGLEEEKRLLVIALLCGILNGDVASFVGANLGLNSCVSICLFESLSFSNPKTCPFRRPPRRASPPGATAAATKTRDIGIVPLCAVVNESTLHFKD
jgi:hypothetical protein